MLETLRKENYKLELKKIIIEKKEKKKLDSLLNTYQTLSPEGKKFWDIKSGKVSNFDVDMISNPFVEKSDIVNHKKKI